MPYSFYSNSNYIKEQSERTKKYWREGKYNLLIKPLEKRLCKNPNCNTFFEVKPGSHRIYCSHSCSAIINNSKRVRITKICLNCTNYVKRGVSIYCSISCQHVFNYRKYITAWKNGQEDGNRGITTRVISKPLKRYLWEKYQDKCFLCGWDKKNPTTGRIPLEIDHIDGNAENNKEENLRLICPNCHSLTASFRNLNKGKGRNWRLKYLKTKSSLL